MESKDLNVAQSGSLGGSSGVNSGILTILLIPLSFSIAEGLAVDLITYPLLKGVIKSDT